MKIYRIEGKLLSPLALKRNRQSDRSETVQSIPGTTLRGALATIYLQQHGQVDDTFNLLFLNEQHCRFGPLDPADNIYPLTMSACKRHPESHPKVDQLPYRIALHLNQGKIRNETHKRYRECRAPDCQADLKGYVGFWQTEGEQVRDHTPEAEYVAAHVGIDRTTATAADGIFYTLEALTARSPRNNGHADLIGWVQASDEAVRALKAILDEEEGTVYLGHHRTRGYGRVRLEISAEPAVELTGDREKWESWSSSMIAFVQRALDPDVAGFAPDPPSLDPSQDTLFAISLPTGAILVDRLLRYTVDLSAMVPWLPSLPNPARLFPIEARPKVSLGDGGELRCVAAVTNLQLLRGWNTAHGLPRQDEWMAARGSVYVYWLRGSSEDRKQLFDMLSQLAAAGIGLRRNEGYGLVVINDPIHCKNLLQEAHS